MGRKKKEINPVVLYDMFSKGMTQKEIAKTLGVSHVTLAKRIAEIKSKKGILLKYRSLQTLKLTSLQARILEAVSPEKIKDASLVDLVKAFKVLKSAEMGFEKDRTKITGLADYLIELERRSNQE
jgi:transposase